MSTWPARCRTHSVATLRWADGATTAPETVSFWLLTTSMPWSTSSRSATGWSLSSWGVWSSEVQFDHPYLLYTFLLNEWLAHRLITSISLHPRYILPAARGGGHHRGSGGRRCVLLLRAGSLAPHAVVQCGFQPALAGLGGDGHQVPAGGLQHQWEQCRHDATSVRSPEATHHLLPEGTFHLCVFICVCILQ